MLSPGVDWNSADGLATEQLEVRLTEPVAPSDSVGYSIAIENKGAAELATPIVVEIEVPRLDGLDLPIDTAWACDALDATTVRCNHPGGMPGASTSVLEFAGTTTPAGQATEPDEDPDPEVDEIAAGESDTVLRSEGGSPAADTALAVGALGLTAFVIFGARRLVSRRR